MSKIVGLALGLAVATGCHDGPMNEGNTSVSGTYHSSAEDAAATTAVDEEEEPEDTGAASLECDEEAPVTFFISPDDSNSMSSPVQARMAVLSGGLFGGVPIRGWEFLNYYTFDYPAAPEDDVRLEVELAPTERDDHWSLQIAVASEGRTNASRPPMNLTFVLDTSGSMSGTPIEMLRKTGEAVSSSLNEGDLVSMVTWSSSNATVLDSHHVVGPFDPTVLAAFNGLEANGGTNLSGGLAAGYALAEQNYVPGRINRVFLVSDGGANLGVTDAEIIGEHAGAHDEDGIYMVGVGVGTASTYNDYLMDQVTDIGKGASLFIGDVDEAYKMFGPDRVVSTLDVAARDVQVQLDLPPGFEIDKFSGEEYSTDPSEIEPQHLAPNDAMVFFQSISTCAPDLVDDDATIAVTVTYKDAVTFEERSVRRTFTFGELLDAGTRQLRKGAALFTYAEALSAVSQGDDSRIDEALVRLADAEAESPGDADLAEIRRVLEAL